MVELNIHRLNLLEHTSLKKVGPRIELPQVVPLLLTHYRRKLKKVAYEQHLRPAKRNVWTALVATQHGIDGIQQIGPHHAYFIDNKQLEIEQQALLVSPHLHLRKKLAPFGGCRQKQLRGQLKKRMDSHALGIDSRHTRRRHHDHLFGTLLLQTAQKRGFSCPCLSGQE